LFSVDTLLVFENIRRQCCPTGWAKKLQTLVHIFIKYWWILQILSLFDPETICNKVYDITIPTRKPS